MNISSIVVFIQKENEAKIIKQLNGIDNCEYHLNSGDGRLIVTLEGDSLDDELKGLMQIKQIPGVISAEMHYSYSEDELNSQRDKLELKPELPTWLNDEKADLHDIKYNGDLRGKF